jgi:pantetheine-phosphate adenylyltransferase
MSHRSTAAASGPNSATAPGAIADPSARNVPALRRRVGVFPGQFDPVTSGHLDVIRRGVALFDELIVAIGINPEKRELFTQDERVKMVEFLTGDLAHVRVEKYAGLTVDFVRQVKATAILRGIRDVSDLRYEFQLALANRAVGGIETVFIMAGEQFALTSSSLIRQVVALKGDIRQLRPILPDFVIDRLLEKQGQPGFEPPKGELPVG